MPICLPSFVGVAQPASGTPCVGNQYSVSFDGSDDYLWVGDQTELRLTSNFSLSCWVKGDSFDTVNGSFILAKRDYASPSAQNFQLVIFASSTAGNVYINTDSSQNPIASTSQISTGSWFNIVVTVNPGTEAKIYINGSLDKTTSIPAVQKADTPLSIGGWTNNSSGFAGGFDGLIDEVAIFDSLLTATDVTAIYNSGVPNDIGTNGLNLNPVGWWRMGDNDGGTGTTITDQGTGGNDGTLTNGPTFSTGVPRYVINQYSVSFDGSNDYINVPHNTSLSLSSAGTFSVWVKMDTSHSIDYPYLFAKWAGSDENYTFFTKATGESAGKFRMRYWDGSSAQSSATEINRGEWVHLAATLDGSNLIFYVNGSADNTVSMGMGTTNTGDLRIGYSPSNTRAFPGLIDEAAIFNSALSSSEISSIYNCGTPNDISSLSPVGWWRMGDGTEAGSGTTVYDMSDNSNNGTLTNGPTYSTSVPVFNQYSVSFDGSNDYAIVTQASAINISGDITLSAWVNRTATTSYNAIYTKRQVGGSMNYQFTIDNSNGQIGLGHSGGAWVYNTTTTLSTSTWYHVAVTVSSGTAQFYVNGVAEDSFTGISITATTQDLFIGATNGYNYFGGNIDEASIFNSALSSTNITAIYNSGVPNDLGTDGLNLSPVGWWRMGDNDGGTGTTITDQGSGGNDGTLNNIASPNGFVTDLPS